MSSDEKKSTATETKIPDAPHRIFFVRHGETNWNREFRYQGISDVELNETGVEQARLTGVRLSKIVPARVYASPLKRALRTAEIIMENNSGGAAIELCEDLREISFGSWEGLTVSEIMERDAATLTAWRAAPFSAVPKGGEPFAGVASRSARAARMMKGAGAPGDVTFVVAHGAVLRALIAAFMNIEDIDLLWRLRFDNCSVSVIDMWGSHPSFLLSNDTHHMRMREENIGLLDFPE
jgi:alpha-ribazole phosphatase/probable phosphoglycerate mutase